MVRGNFQLRECEKLLTEIFYGSSDMVEGIADNQKSVVNIESRAYIYWCILVILTLQIKL